MATSINTVSLSGNVVRNAAALEEGSGFKVTNFTIAVDERRKNKAGEWEDAASYIDCQYFGEAGAAIAPKLAAGTRICLQGHLRSKSYEDRNGVRRKSVTVAVDKIDILAKAEKEDAGFVYEL